MLRFYILIGILFFTSVDARFYHYKEIEHSALENVLDQTSYFAFISGTAYLNCARWAGNPSWEYFLDANRHFTLNDDSPDQRFINWVAHPYYGSLTYLYFRSKGYSFEYSALSSFFQSLVFEFAGESWYGAYPALNDIIVTPSLGIALGMSLEYLSENFLNYGYLNKNYFLIALGHMVNPFSLLFINKNTDRPIEGYPLIIPQKKGISLNLLIALN